MVFGLELNINRSTQGVASGQVELTVLLPVKDEEIHLERALGSVSWAKYRVVVDSFSSDKTMAIAKKLGATVVQHEWQFYSAQMNWALANVDFKTDWVFVLDADEYVTNKLAAEVRTVVEAADRPNAFGFYVSRRVFFMGRRLDHAYWYPDKALRLFRRSRARYDDRRTHERVIVDGPTGELSSDLIHENLKDFHEFIDRHNRYSTLEALDRVDLRSGKDLGSLRASFFGDWGQRRRALKDIWIRLPIFTRPFIRFMHIYLWRRGFLDGVPGLVLAALMSGYEMDIDVKYLLAKRSLSRSLARRAPEEMPYREDPRTAT
jgi:glycosyltransferase involved in cell wall biosynthesis